MRFWIDLIVFFLRSFSFYDVCSLPQSPKCRCRSVRSLVLPLLGAHLRRVAVSGGSRGTAREEHNVALVSVVRESHAAQL